MGQYGEFHTVIIIPYKYPWSVLYSKVVRYQTVVCWRLVNSMQMTNVQDSVHVTKLAWLAAFHYVLLLKLKYVHLSKRKYAFLQVHLEVNVPVNKSSALEKVDILMVTVISQNPTSRIVLKNYVAMIDTWMCFELNINLRNIQFDCSILWIMMIFPSAADLSVLRVWEFAIHFWRIVGALTHAFPSKNKKYETPCNVSCDLRLQITSLNKIFNEW